MTVSTKRPLSDEERGLLLRAFTRDSGSTSADYRTTRLIWSTGCHPWSLANSDLCNWRMVVEHDRPYLSYIRAKTREETHLDLDPEIAPWWAEFVETNGMLSVREYHYRVSRYGAANQLTGLSPRGLRHDRIFLHGRACKWDLPYLQMTFGTDARTLLRYMALDRAHEHSDAVLRGAFGQR